MNRYDLLIFDWDGTLADSVGRIVECMRIAANELGLEARSDPQIKGIIGLGLPEAIAELYPGLVSSAAIERFRRVYSEHYLRLEVEPSPLFGGVRQGLEAFRLVGCQLAVATGKSRKGLDRVLASHGWQHYFEVTRCADETASKPDPLMLNEILAQRNVRPERALMVGDSVFDLLMAARAGLDAVAVSYGAQPVKALQACRPKCVIDHFGALGDWLASSVACGVE